MHIFHHVLYEGIGLRQLLDYYFILRRLDGAQRRQVIEDLKYLGLARFAEAVMYVEQQVFGLEPEYCLCQPNEKQASVCWKRLNWRETLGSLTSATNK